MPGPRSSKTRPGKPLLGAADRNFLRAVVRLASANPWLPARIEAEREALGDEFVEVGRVMTNLGRPNENVRRIGVRLGAVLERVREKLAGGAMADDEDRALYQIACCYDLFDRFDDRLEARLGTGDLHVPFYTEFAQEHGRLLGVVGAPWPARHLFAAFDQLRRAYHYLFTCVLGGSMAAARLRAAAWESIFTADLRAYLDGLFEVVKEIPTLILGPSGTGKELVARAIGLSRYIPFDEDRMCFESRHDEGYLPLNLSALSPSIIESELFGHCRGAFTGAVDQRVGWLEQVAPGGTLFLDEIGDVETTLQVKLLRVLERGEFQRLGETETRIFAGRLVAATHRDLAALIERGAFREDLYFRLCGHVIATPSLRAQLDDAPEELPRMVRLLAARIVKPPFVEPLAERAVRWIQTELPPDYAWPGNVRELAQCLRNVLMSGAYRPLGKQVVRRTEDEFYRRFEEGRLTADEILRRYVTLVHAQTGSYRETARRTGLTRRTLAEKIDQALLATLIKEGAGKGSRG